MAGLSMRPRRPRRLLLLAALLAAGIARAAAQTRHVDNGKRNVRQLLLVGERPKGALRAVHWGMQAPEGGRAVPLEEAGVDWGRAEKVVSTDFAFAVLHTDGSVRTFGAASSGGDSSTVANQLRSDVRNLYAGSSSFLAIQRNGTVVLWGGGVSTVFVKEMMSNARYAVNNGDAWAVLKDDGDVQSFGASAMDKEDGARYEYRVSESGDQYGRKVVTRVLPVRDAFAVCGEAFAKNEEQQPLGLVLLRVWGKPMAADSPSPASYRAANPRYKFKMPEDPRRPWAASTGSVFWAIDESGDLQTWPSSNLGFKNVSEALVWGPEDKACMQRSHVLRASTGAFCAICQPQGRVACWGDPYHGGGQRAPELDFRVGDLIAHEGSFCALEERVPGRIRCWGGLIEEGGFGLDNVEQALATDLGIFIMATDGQVVILDAAQPVGPEGAKAGKSQIVKSAAPSSMEVVLSSGAIFGIKGARAIGDRALDAVEAFAFGLPEHGGTLPEDFPSADRVVAVYSSGHGFVAVYRETDTAAPSGPVVEPRPTLSPLPGPPTGPDGLIGKVFIAAGLTAVVGFGTFMVVRRALEAVPALPAGMAFHVCVLGDHTVGPDVSQRVAEAAVNGGLSATTAQADADRCAALVLVLTPDILQAPGVQEALAAARDRNQPVLLVHVAGFDFADVSSEPQRAVGRRSLDALFSMQHSLETPSVGEPWGRRQSRDFARRLRQHFADREQYTFRHMGQLQARIDPLL